MYFRRSLPLLVLLLATTLVSAQSDISGTVVDSTGTTLTGANVVVLRASDSLLMGFATTDGKGDFLLEDIAVGEHQLHLSFLGYERAPQSVIVSESDQYLGLGEMIMYPAGYLLSGVEVTAGRIPIRMKGDTMMYDAEAFAVGQNASVEDLLRRLPGMSIDASGAITWRGQPVQQVFVNGRPFFAGNATMITQNLDAAAIDNVEVFDQQSNREELSGVDDGVENTTINLEMKEEFKAKVFGDLQAGYGTNERYRFGAKLFRISDVSQFGLLGTLNNINQVGFSGDEMMSFNQSMGQGRRFSVSRNGGIPVSWGGGQAAGQNRSLATGLNYGTTFGKTELQLSYSLFDRDQTQIQQINEAINRPGAIRETFTDDVNALSSYSHRIDLNLEQDLDSLSQMDLSLAVYTLGNNDNNLSNVTISDPNNGDQSYSVDQLSDEEQPGGNFNLEYSRRLGKPGRLLTLDASGGISQTNEDVNILTSGLSEQLAIPGALINGLQVQDRLTENRSLYGGLNFIEPLSDRWQWDTDVYYSFNEAEGDYGFELEGQNARSQLERGWNDFTVGTGLIYRFGDRNNLSIKANYTSATLDINGDTNRSTRYNYLLPRINLRLRSQKLYYNLRLGSSASAPQISQLQTIAQPGQSGRVSIGNPDLEPAVDYRASSYIWFNDQFRSLSLYLNGSITYTDNAIGNELTFSEGQQIYRPINVTYAWSNNLNLGTTIGVEALNGEISAGVNTNNSRGLGIVDQVTRTNIANNLGAEFSLNTELNENSYVTLGYEWNRNVNRFEDDRTESVITVSHDIFTKLGLEFSPRWRLEGLFTYRIYEAASFTGATNISDLQLNLEVRPFKTAPHFFRLSAFDLFNQNTVVNRYVDNFVSSETTSDALGRYLLLSFHYKIK